MKIEIEWKDFLDAFRNGDLIPGYSYLAIIRRGKFIPSENIIFWTGDRYNILVCHPLSGRCTQVDLNQSEIELIQLPAIEKQIEIMEKGE